MKHALRGAGGTGGIDQIAKLMGIRLLITGKRFCTRHDLVKKRNVDHQCALRILTDEIDPLLRIIVLDQNKRRARPENTKHAGIELKFFRQQEHHDLFFSDPFFLQIPVYLCPGFIHFGIGDALPVCHKRL